MRPLLLTLSILLTLAATARAELIRSFDADLKLDRDGTLHVTEHIAMDFESASRHGIFRIVPVQYERYRQQYTVDLAVESVTDGQGNNRTYSVQRQGPDVNVKIGDADRLVTGREDYVLTYRLRRVVNVFTEGSADGRPEPELYWNVTGNEWPYPIRQVTARLTPPDGVPIDKVRAKSFIGVPGSTDPGIVDRDGGAVIFSAGNLRPGEGLTLVARLPSGSIVLPGWATRLGWIIKDWWPAVVFPLITFGLLFWRWTTAGRDVGGGQAIAVEWDPPENLSPAEMGTLIDESCDMSDVVSTLVDLAARGYLSIEQLDEKGWFTSSSDYRFTRQDPPADARPLLPHEERFYDALFKYGAVDRRKVMLSDLKGSFHASLGGIRKGIFRALMDRKFFTANPETVRATYTMLGVFVGVAGLVLTFVGYQGGFVAWGIGVALAGGLILAFARAMPAKTLAGSTALREVLGFKRFLMLVEKDRLVAEGKADPSTFSRLLPYAIVLGVADEWAGKFADLLTAPPDWFVSGRGGPFVPRIFIGDLGRGMGSMGQVFGTRPQSSTNLSSSRGGGGGFSGWSGGGGFSGGGFGGGGGGSW